jgi:hypothetical protein
MHTPLDVGSVRPYANLMSRFQLGDRALLTHFMGSDYPAPRDVTIVGVIGGSMRSLMYDYKVRLGDCGSIVNVEASWLASSDYEIVEDCDTLPFD